MSTLAPTDEFRARVLEGRGLAEAGDFRAAEEHFRALLGEARGRHAGNHVLAVKSLITLYGRSGRYLEVHVLARSIVQRARDAGPDADETLGFGLGAVCGALSQLRLHEPLGHALADMRVVLDRAPRPMLNVELGYHAAASVYARECGDFEQARRHWTAYGKLVQDAEVQDVFRWALHMGQAQVAHHEGNHALARDLIAGLDDGEKTPPFHRLRELRLATQVHAALGNARDARASAHEALGLLEAVREQSGLASGRIFEGTDLARALESMGEIELAARVHDFVAAAVLIRLRQVDQCMRELPELGLADDESAALLTRFRRQFVSEQRELLRRVAKLLESRGDAYVQALLARSAPEGLVAICAWCESVRPSDGRWLPLGHYIPREASFDVTHSICTPCAGRMRPTRPRAR